MTSLITDRAIRRIAQTLLILVFIFEACVPGIVIATVIMRKHSILLHGEMLELARTFFAVISIPLSSTIGQLAAAATTALPLIVGAVCFQIDTASTPWKAGTSLNWTGGFILFLLLVGAVLSLIVVIACSVSPYLDALNSVAGTPAQATLVKGVIGGILSLQILYVSQLIGWKPA